MRENSEVVIIYPHTYIYILVNMIVWDLMVNTPKVNVDIDAENHWFPYKNFQKAGFPSV